MGIHSPHESSVTNGSNAEVKCNKYHHWLYKKTIADVVEALVGAFLVDSGFKAATAFLKWIGIQVNFEASQITNIWSASTILMPLASHIDIAALENLLEYQFLHKGLLIEAFVHPSYNNHCGGCYQRMEFLGDAVLDYLITSYLYSAYPKLKPGQLTDLRSISVNNNCFADISVHRSFHKFIICDSSSLRESMNKYVNFIETSASERGLIEPRCPKALGDLVESCVGAVLLDTGFDLNRVWKIMLSFLDPIMNFTKLQFNPIRELHELCQSNNWDLHFLSTKKDGKYIVEAKVNREGVSETACAINLNRKAAKTMASKDLFLRLKAQGFKTKFKSLEEVLKKSRKMEAKLIGFDEKPNNIIDHCKLQEPSTSVCHLKVHPTSAEHTKNCSPRVQPTGQHPSLFEAPVCQPTVATDNSSCHAKSPSTGGSRKGEAKSRLYEICAANYWKPPVFECCQESGPSHLKEFIFKVVVVIGVVPNTELECMGKPCATKKDAAEHAAEGALWYLKHEGYLKDIN